MVEKPKHKSDYLLDFILLLPIISDILKIQPPCELRVTDRKALEKILQIIHYFTKKCLHNIYGGWTVDR